MNEHSRVQRGLARNPTNRSPAGASGGLLLLVNGLRASQLDLDPPDNPLA
ncbi:MAG: hypothetical protein M3Q71_14400 [Chloroflexota bacterium]|nr:hypothetical protein [Chloroflexota bacterium]